VDLSKTFQIWRRRWILTTGLLILASAGTAAALTGLPRVYQSNSAVILLASRSVARLTGGNPYLSFSPSLTLTAQALIQELMAPQTAQDLAARGYSGTYTVTLAPDTTQTTGSVLIVTVTDSRRTAAERTLYAVTDDINSKLSQLQTGVRRNSRIQATALAVAPHATLNVSQTVRPLVILIALAFSLALGIPVVVDGKITRRRIRNGAAEPDLARAPTPGGGAIAGRGQDRGVPAQNDGQSHRAARASR
jgi:hypothetical protein